MNKNNKNRNRWVIHPTFNVGYERWIFRSNRKGVFNLRRKVRKILNSREDDNN